MNRRNILSTLVAASVLLCPAAFAQTPEWPQAKPITCIVPFTAGGSTDVVGRTIGQTLQEALKQTGVVDNKPGQGGASARASSPRPHRMATRSSAARSARTPSTPACIKNCPTTRHAMCNLSKGR